MFGGLFGGGGNNNAAKKAAETAERMGKQALELGQKYEDQTRADYAPWISGGLGAFQQGLAGADKFLQQQLNLPDAYKPMMGELEELYNNYREKQSQGGKDYADLAVPTGPDYENAQNTSLYKTLMQNSQDAINNNAAGMGMSVRGSGNQLDIARAANKNTQDVANQIYQNDLNNYQLNTEQDRYREGQDINQLIRDQANSQNIFNAGLSLNQLKNQYGQQGWQNERANATDVYNANNQNLSNYLSMLMNSGNMGLNAQNNMSQATGNAVNSQIGSLGGMAQNAVNAAAAQQSSGGGGLGNLFGIGGAALGSMFGMPMLGGAIGSSIGGMMG